MTSELIPCPDCGLTFFERDMSLHREMAHAADEKEEIVKDEKHVCEYCGREFKSGNALGGHKRGCKKSPKRRLTRDSDKSLPMEGPKNPRKPARKVDPLADVPTSKLKGELVRRLREKRDECDRYLHALKAGL